MVLRPWNWTTPGWLPTYIPEGRRGRPPLRLARLSLALCFSLSLSGRPRCRRAGGPTTGRLRGRTGHPWIGPWIGCAGVAGWLAGLIHSRGRTAGGAMEQSPSNNRSTPQTAAVPSLDRLPPALIVKLCVSIGLEGQETMDGVPPPPPGGPTCPLAHQSMPDVAAATEPNGQPRACCALHSPGLPPNPLGSLGLSALRNRRCSPPRLCPAVPSRLAGNRLGPSPGSRRRGGPSTLLTWQHLSPAFAYRVLLGADWPRFRLLPTPQTRNSLAGRLAGSSPSE